MRDLQNRIQQMLRDRKRNLQFIALFFAVSMIIAFVVPYLSIMPGVALTNATLMTNDFSPTLKGVFDGV